MTIFLRAAENMGGMKKTNGGANHVDEEGNPEGKYLLAHQPVEDQHVQIRFSRNASEI